MKLGDLVSLCRLMFFEQAREQEEQKYKQNNQDVVVCMSSAHTLLSTSQPLWALATAIIRRVREDLTR